MENDTSITEREVRLAFEHFLTALSNADIAALERIYAADYLLVKPNGQRLDRAQILDDLQRHAMHFTVFDLRGMQIRIAGAAGIVCVDSRHTFLRGGAQGYGHDLQTAVSHKTSAGIVLVHFHSTNVTD